MSPNGTGRPVTAAEISSRQVPAREIHRFPACTSWAISSIAAVVTRSGGKVRVITVEILRVIRGRLLETFTTPSCISMVDISGLKQALNCLSERGREESQIWYRTSAETRILQLKSQTEGGLGDLTDEAGPWGLYVSQPWKRDLGNRWMRCWSIGRLGRYGKGSPFHSCHSRNVPASCKSTNCRIGIGRVRTIITRCKDVETTERRDNVHYTASLRYEEENAA